MCRLRRSIFGFVYGQTEVSVVKHFISWWRGKDFGIWVLDQRNSGEFLPIFTVTKGGGLGFVYVIVSECKQVIYTVSDLD